MSSNTLFNVMVVERKRLEVSNIITPIFSAITCDLVFWIVVNSLFLAEVKGLSASEINLLNSISSIVVITCLLFAEKIIKIIGDVKAVRLGSFMLVVTMLILTFGKGFYMLLFGYCLYSIAFLFKQMDCVVLAKNLHLANRSKDYLHLRNLTSFIYSFITMIISFTASSIYNINPYLPNYLGIGVTVVGFIMSFFIYDPKIENVEHQKEKVKIDLTKVLLFVFIGYFLTNTVMDVGMSQARLFIQDRLNKYYSSNEMASKLLFIVALSRVVRTASNFFFTRNKKKDGTPFLRIIAIDLVLSFIVIMLGELVSNITLKFVVYSIGFYMILAIRDPLSNILNYLLLTNSKSEVHEKLLLYVSIISKLGNFIFNLIISMLLGYLDIYYALVFMLVTAIIDVFFAFRLVSIAISSKQNV